MSKTEEYIKLMDNSESLCNKYDYNYLYELGKNLPFSERVAFDYKIKCINNNIKFFQSSADYLNEDELLKLIIKNDELEYVLNNIDDILRPFTLINFEVVEYLSKKQNKLTDDEINKIKILITQKISRGYKLEEKYINELKDLIEKVAQNEQLSFFDIREIKKGGYSRVYKIGNKIIKVGEERACNYIVNNNRILIPDFIGYIGEDFIEVTDYIDDQSYIRRSDVYNIYKALRNQGIIWLDPKAENVKRIDEVNSSKQKEKRKQEINSNFILQNPNYIDDDNESEFVIIDLDHILFESDNNAIERIMQTLPSYLKVTLELFNKKFISEKEGKKLIIIN